jgi:Flp pilus assembly protein TadG
LHRIRQGRQVEKLTARKRYRQGGTVLVETAITLFLLITFLFGIMEVGRFISVQQVVTDAAREGARLAIAPLSQTTTMATQDEVTDMVNTFLAASHIQGATVNIDRPVASLLPARFTKVEVSVVYEPILSVLIDRGITLKGEALMRDETSP